MKKITLLLVVLNMVQYFNVDAQSENCVWARQSTSAGTETCTGVATDAAGNVYTTGYFQDTTVTFGSFSFHGGNYPGSSAEDMYIAKYSSTGTVLWAKGVGTQRYEQANSIAVDGLGNAYVTGYFDGPNVTFGTITLTNTSWGYAPKNMFIVKYDTNGNVIWAKTNGDTTYGGGAQGISIAVDQSNNVYVTGSISGTVFLGSDTLRTSPLGYGRTFIAKYDSNGNEIWARQSKTTHAGIDGGVGIATDPTGNVVVFGNYREVLISFGNITLTNSVISNTEEMFVVKYDSNGNVLWAKSEGGSGADEGYGVSSDASGNTYITGWFARPTITFGSTTFTGSGQQNVFFVKLDANGNAVWAKEIGYSNWISGFSIATDASGVYLAGMFDVSTQITIGSFTLYRPSTFYEPNFLAKYDFNGNAICASVFGSGENPVITTDNLGNVVYGGSFHISPFILGTDTLTLTFGGTNSFVGKFTCSPGSGINDVSNKDENTTIYPNPTTGEFTISANAKAESINVEIYNVLGQMVYATSQKETNKLTIALNQPPGLYFVTVTRESFDKLKTTEMLKLVKE